jgi:hypothetical protein
MSALRVSAAKAAPTTTRTAVARVQKRSLVVRVRAEAPAPSSEPAPAAPAAQPVAAATPAPMATPAAAAPAAAVALPPSAWEAMMISAPVRNNVPFAVNGRLAQLGVVAAVGCELFTHQSVVEQFQAHSGLVLGLAGLITVASFVPVLRGAAADEAFGPLTPRAERFNSEAAILGFVALLVLEAAKGSSFF